jgi:hypothetical protein
VIVYRAACSLGEWRESKWATQIPKEAPSRIQSFAGLCAGKRACFRVTQSASHIVKDGNA